MTEEQECKHRHKFRDPQDDNCMLCGGRVFTIEDELAFKEGIRIGLEKAIEIVDNQESKYDFDTTICAIIGKLKSALSESEKK